MVRTMHLTWLCSATRDRLLREPEIVHSRYRMAPGRKLVPETSGMVITEVTPSSFSLVFLCLLTSLMGTNYQDGHLVKWSLLANLVWRPN